MRFLMLSYNARFIKPNHLKDFVEEIFRNHSCPVHTIEHFDQEAAPIFCIEAVDTEGDEDK